MFLTEEKLNDYLKIIFPDVDDWIRNKIVPKSNSRFRPDYRSEKLKMIIENDKGKFFQILSFKTRMTPEIRCSALLDFSDILPRKECAAVSWKTASGTKIHLYPLEMIFITVPMSSEYPGLSSNF